MAIDVDDLEQKARAAKPELNWNLDTYLSWPIYRTDGKGLIECFAGTVPFVVAATPAAVLELIKRLRAAERVASAASIDNYDEGEYLAALDAWDAAKR